MQLRSIQFNTMPMRRALLIGINDYPGDLRLSGCVEDIHCLKDAIERHGNGEKNFGVKLMENVQTSEEVMEGITELFHDNADVALLYFSGHGYISTTGAEIVTPYEVTHSGMHYKGVQMKEIMELVHKSKVKQVVFLTRAFLFLLLAEKMRRLAKPVVMVCLLNCFVVRCRVVLLISMVTLLWVASMLTLTEVLENGSRDLSLRRMCLPLCLLKKLSRKYL